MERAQDRASYRLPALPPSSRSRYARKSPNPWGNDRRVNACCYHAFRDYIDRAFEAGATRVKSTQGDWLTFRDFSADLSRLAHANIGSQMFPRDMVDMCQCEAFGIHLSPGGGALDPETWARVAQDHRVQFGRIEPDGNGGINVVNVRTIRQADMAACPFCIMVPSHYRPDGTCKCNDPEERAMMIKEWGYTKASFRRAGIVPA